MLALSLPLHVHYCFSVAVPERTEVVLAPFWLGPKYLGSWYRTYVPSV